MSNQGQRDKGTEGLREGRGMGYQPMRERGFYWRYKMCGHIKHKITPGTPRRSCPICGCRLEETWLPAPATDPRTTDPTTDH
jgi:rubrerythrin